MPSRLPTETCPKAAISVSDMARVCGLSRSHFNFLVKTGVMPQPIYRIANRRPFYDAQHQQICLRVRETNMGADGQYVVFYARRNVTDAPVAPARTRRSNRQQLGAQTTEHGELLEGLRALGMTEINNAQVDAAVRNCYPGGHAGIDEGTVLRELWRHLRRTEGVR